MLLSCVVLMLCICFYIRSKALQSLCCIFDFMPNQNKFFLSYLINILSAKMTMGMQAFEWQGESASGWVRWRSCPKYFHFLLKIRYIYCKSNCESKVVCLLCSERRMWYNIFDLSYGVFIWSVTVTWNWTVKTCWIWNRVDYFQDSC